MIKWNKLSDHKNNGFGEFFMTGYTYSTGYTYLVFEKEIKKHNSLKFFRVLDLHNSMKFHLYLINGRSMDYPKIEMRILPLVRNVNPSDLRMLLTNKKNQIFGKHFLNQNKHSESIAKAIHVPYRPQQIFKRHDYYKNRSTRTWSV